VLNNLSGAHLELFPETAKKIRELGLNPFIIGTGVIPPEDQVFGPGTPPQTIVEAIKKWEQANP